MSLPVFPVVILSSNTEHISRVAWKKATEQKVRPCFFTKSVKFRSFEVFLVPIESSRRDLQSGHGFEACFWKNKRKMLDFHTFGGQNKWKKNEKVGRNRSNVGLLSSKLSGSNPLGRRENSRKFWAWRTLKKPKKSKCSPDCSPFFPWIKGNWGVSWESLKKKKGKNIYFVSFYPDGDS